MKPIILLFVSWLSLTLVGCASRGIELAQQLPELYSGFDKDDYLKIENDTHLMYYSKNLAKQSKPPEKFEETHYTSQKNKEGLRFFTPKNQSNPVTKVITKKTVSPRKTSPYQSFFTTPKRNPANHLNSQHKSNPFLIDYETKN